MAIAIPADEQSREALVCDLFANAAEHDLRATNHAVRMRLWKRRRRAFRGDRLRALDESKKARIGARIIEAYCEDVGMSTSAIDWKRLFAEIEAWMNDHIVLLIGVKIGITLLFLFCL